MRVIKGGQLPARRIEPSWRTYQLALWRAEKRRQKLKRIARWAAFYAALAFAGIVLGFVMWMALS